MIADLIYGLCALTALLCTYLLFQAYRRSRYRLLLWGGLCFVGLTLNNILLIMDKMVLADIDLSLWRTATAACALFIFLFGLIWDTES